MVGLQAGEVCRQISVLDKLLSYVVYGRVKGDMTEGRKALKEAVVSVHQGFSAVALLALNSFLGLGKAIVHKEDFFFGITTIYPFM